MFPFLQIPSCPSVARPLFLIRELPVAAELIHHLYERFIDDPLPALGDTVYVDEGCVSKQAISTCDPSSKLKIISSLMIGSLKVMDFSH